MTNGDTGEDGFVGLTPMAQYASNGYWMYDMSGNVWEGCSDWYRPNYFEELTARADFSVDPQGPSSPHDPAEPDQPKRVHRGGSFLCTDV